MTKVYWQQRMQGEKSFAKWIEQTENRLFDYYQVRYNELLEHLNAEIAKEYAALTRSTGMNLDLAKQTVSNLDIKAYSQLAKKVVREAHEARKNGNPKAFKGYSAEINRRMKIYNATMRINRLELLKARLATWLLEVNAELDADLRKALSDGYVEHVTKQAGLLGTTVSSSAIDQGIQEAIAYMYDNATFSDRIWKNQDVIKASIDKVVSQGSLGGYGLEKMINQLHKFTNANYSNAKRIVRTEMTRVMDKAQEDVFKKADVKLVFWQVEKKPCAACLAIHDNDVCYGKGVYPIDDSPKPVEDTHPNCRCLRSAFTEYEAWQLQWAKSKDKGVYLDQYGRVRYSDGRLVEDYLEAEKLYNQDLKNKSKKAKPAGAIVYDSSLSLSEKLKNKELEKSRLEAKRQKTFAQKYYATLRNYKRDFLVSKIAKNTGISSNIVIKAIEHVLDSKYNLDIDGKMVFQTFEPDADMAHSLQNLYLNNYDEADILLLHHENLEAYYMDKKGMSYVKAHKLTNKRYDYQDKIDQLKEEGKR